MIFLSFVLAQRFLSGGTMLAPSTTRRKQSMCYNCGCQKPDDDMGNSKNITNKTFEEAASASGKKPDEAKKNVLQLLEKQQAAKK